MRVLLIGESWSSFELHQKGFNAYTAGAYEEGGQELVEALIDHNIEVDRLLTHRATVEFPRSQTSLEAYDVIILSDVGADTLQLHPATLKRGERTTDPLELLVGFVQAGGGLLMIGGYMSFSGFEGRARYGQTPLAAVLPVDLLGYDDRVECPQGIEPDVQDAAHTILRGLPQEWPWFLGYNRTRLKEDADLLLTVGADPLLAVRSVGSGRVGAFTSDLAPHWGSPAFLSWEHYGTFWSQLVSWLGSSLR